MTFLMNKFHANLLFITLLGHVGPHNITVGCLKFSPNLSLRVQLFKHLIVIFERPTKQELNVKSRNVSSSFLVYNAS